MKFLILTGAVPLIIMAFMLRHASKRHGLSALIWRWHTGQPWHGRPHTNATWRLPADRVLHPSGRASRWAHMRVGYRTAIRTTLSLSLLGTGYGLVEARQLTLRALLGLSAVLVIGAILAGYRIWREARHTATWIKPLHHALAIPAQRPLAIRPKSWLTVPRNFSTSEDAEVIVQLPPDYTGGTDSKTAAQLPAIIQAKLGLEEITYSYHRAGPVNELHVATSIPPPSKVSLGMVRDAMTALPASEILAGIGRKSSYVTFSLEEDSPHVLIAASSGIGKSVLAKTIIVQALMSGAVVIVLDKKRTSHPYLRGLPNVLYVKDIKDIHDVLVMLEVELERRNILSDELTDINGDIKDIGEIGPRILIVAEEMNATSVQLKKYWERTRTKDDPKKSPAVEAWGEILFMGRAALVNVLAITQMGTAGASGGGAARENMGVRILGGASKNAHMMLAPEIQPIPRYIRKPGRFHLISGGVAREFQGARISNAEARELATSGVVAELSSLAQLEAMSGGLAVRDPAPGSALTRGNGAGSDPASQLVTLREAASQGILTATLEAARLARKRDPAFPRAAGISDGAMTYDPADLARWERNRPVASASPAERNA
jgi:hypothetical protein